MLYRSVRLFGSMPASRSDGSDSIATRRRVSWSRNRSTTSSRVGQRATVAGTLFQLNVSNQPCGYDGGPPVAGATLRCSTTTSACPACQRIVLFNPTGVNRASLSLTPSSSRSVFPRTSLASSIRDSSGKERLQFPPLPVRRERVGVRGDGAAQLERRAPSAVRTHPHPNLLPAY